MRCISLEFKWVKETHAYHIILILLNNQLFHAYGHDHRLILPFCRRTEADAIYQKGIQRRARPLDPLKRRYDEFKSRTSAPPPVQPSAAWQDAPAETRALRRAPLKNHPSSSIPSSSRDGRASSSRSASARSASTSTAAEQSYHPYALMLAPPLPGKRKEKLRFNLSLLFTEDGTEYSMQEARARSMGLLGKKWGPPPVPERDRRVGFSSDASKSAKTSTTRKFAAGAEPTVTLATKEALADVFGMFNSPEKSMRFGPVPGSKHAPVRKIEPVTPLSLHPLLRSMSNENADASKTPGGSLCMVIGGYTADNGYVSIQTIRRRERAAREYDPRRTSQGECPVLTWK